MNIVCEFGRFKTHQRNQKMHTFLIYFILFNVCIINNWKIQADQRSKDVPVLVIWRTLFCFWLVKFHFNSNLPVVGSWQQ